MHEGDGERAENHQLTHSAEDELLFAHAVEGEHDLSPGLIGERRNGQGDPGKAGGVGQDLLKRGIAGFPEFLGFLADVEALREEFECLQDLLTGCFRYLFHQLIHWSLLAGPS